jgi:hypothetical protein
MQECVYLMDIDESTKIYTFGIRPPKADFVQPKDPVLEIPTSEFQDLLKELATTYNQIAEIVRDAGILRGRELAKLTEGHSRALKAEKSPTTKFSLLNAYIRQLLAKIREALKSRPQEGGKIVQVCTKIMARAVQIIDYVKTVVQDDPFRRKEIAFDSQQARVLFSGKNNPDKVSRRDTIRAMKKVEKLCPAMTCDHRPNDGRQTMRLIARVEDLKDSSILSISDCSIWQRSGKSIDLSL